MSDDQITVRFFASLREQLGADETRLSLNAVEGRTVGDVRLALIAQSPSWQALDERLLHCAVNQSLAQDSTPIQAGDEVAFFPPVTGG